MHFTCTKTFVLDYIDVKAQQLFSSHEKKTDCFCYRYPVCLKKDLSIRIKLVLIIYTTFTK